MHDVTVQKLLISIFDTDYRQYSDDIDALTVDLCCYYAHGTKGKL